MDIKVIKEVVAGSHKGTLRFPQVVQMLTQIGIESYQVDLIRNEKRYYKSNGENHLEVVNLPHLNPSEHFSAEGVKTALKRIQQGQTKYLEFLDEISAAGCTGYIAFLSGRRVVYFGRIGDFHIEHFPVSK